MGEYAVEKREITPKNFFAGDFPTVPETGTANAAIKEYAPVMIDTANDNKIIPVAKGSEASAIGIAAAAAGNGEPVPQPTADRHAGVVALDPDRSRVRRQNVCGNVGKNGHVPQRLGRARIVDQGIHEFSPSLRGRR